MFGGIEYNQSYDYKEQRKRQLWYRLIKTLRNLNALFFHVGASRWLAPGEIANIVVPD